MDFDNSEDGQKTATGQRRFVADVVCPVCFKQIENPVIMAEGPDSEGHRLRTYFGYCVGCSSAHVVIQFAREDRWIIHKFRPAVVLGIANVIEIVNDWKLLSELPPAKAEVRSDNLENDEAGTMAALKEMHRAFRSCMVTIESLIKDMAEKRGQSIDD